MLEINKPQEYLNVANSIEQLSNLHCQQYLYPYFYRPMYTILEDGYTMFRSELEFGKLLATDEWRLSSVNKDYTVCPTYGNKLVVPKVISDEEIIQSAAFRDGGRFPLLSYRHENGVSYFWVVSAPPESPRITTFHDIFNNNFTLVLGDFTQKCSTDQWTRETLSCWRSNIKCDIGP